MFELSRVVPSNSKVLFSVSVGQINQENEALAKIVDAIIVEVNNVKSFTLLDTSYLQRFNQSILLISSYVQDIILGDKTWIDIEIEAEELARQAGIKWFSQNAESINKLKEKYSRDFSVLNWESLLLTQKFKERLKLVEKMYKNNGFFQRATNGLVGLFFNRYNLDLKLKRQYKAKIIAFLRKYVFEESALRTLMTFDYEIYRGAENIPAQIAYREFGVSGKMNFISIGEKTELEKWEKDAGKYKSYSKSYIKSDDFNEIQAIKRKSINKQVKELVSGLLFKDLCVAFYWMDINGILLGCNEKELEILNASSLQAVVGKNVSVLESKNNKAGRVKAWENSKKIMREGITQILEERVNNNTFLSIKTPIYRNKIIVGLLGISLDITDNKRAERLLVESKLQRAKIRAQEKFKTVAEQVAHDIRSPLASLSMIVESCKNMPEAERIALCEIATNITDIANNLISTCKIHKDVKFKPKVVQDILLHLVLIDILSEKKYQYKKLPIKFIYLESSNVHFSCIKISRNNFSRLISNLIDNAVEACNGKEGMITLKFSATNGEAQVLVMDNGKGISKAILKKLDNKVKVTSGKKNGNGIGYTQIWDTLQSSNGNIIIDSALGKGTQIKLSFPLVKTSPSWLVCQLTLSRKDTVIVLDDDDSIHKAWDARFKKYKNKISLKHFKKGEEAVKFISTFPNKEKLFLLVDYKLINQNLNGLQIIEKMTMYKRAVLVTSYYAASKVRKIAMRLKIEILPKQLAPSIPIELEKDEGNNSKNVDLVIVDDDPLFANTLANFFREKSLRADVYYDPSRFLKKLTQYTKNTKICMDNNFNWKMTGMEIAKQLTKAGYKNLYLLSGTEFRKDNVPKCVTVLLKGDMYALSTIA